MENYGESDKRKMVIRFSSKEISCDLEKEQLQWEWLGQKHNGVLISERRKNSIISEGVGSACQMQLAYVLLKLQFTCLEEQHNVLNSINFWHQN